MKLAQVAVHASNLGRAAEWWSLVLGSEPTATYDPPGLLFFDLDGTRLLVEAGATPGTVYLLVDSVRERIDALRGAGLTVDGEPHVIFAHDDDTLGPAGTQEWQGFLRDPDGNLVGLVSHEPA